MDFVPHAEYVRVDCVTVDTFLLVAPELVFKGPNFIIIVQNSPYIAVDELETRPIVLTPQLQTLVDNHQAISNRVPEPL